MENKLPEGWEWKKLDEVSYIIMGQSPPGDTYNEKGNGMPFLQGKAEFTDSCPKHVKYTTNPSKVAPEGSILISVRAPVGDVNIANLEYCIGRGLASISLKEGNNKFLFYLLRSLKPEIESKGTGSTFKAISKSILSDLIIPLPPLEIQQKIVAILEKAEETKKLRAQADELTQKFLQSVFLEMFGDPVKNSKQFDIVQLKSVFSEKKEGTKCGPFGSALKKHEYVENGIPVWTMDNITENKFTRNGCLFITEEKYQELKAYSVGEGDILISRAGTVGKMCVVNSIDDPSIISTNLIRLSLNPSKIEAIYFTSLMTYFKGKMGRLKTGEDGTYTFMNTGILKDLRIPLPPFEIQRSFAKIVEQVEKTRYSQQQSSLEINNLFDVLMQKAFAGELVS